MTADDRHAFQVLLTDVMTFYRQDLTDFAMDVWWQACEPYSMEQVRKAMSAHAVDPDSGRFAPKPADVVKVLAGTQTDRSLLAWGAALEAAGRVGAYQSVQFDDPAIHSAIVDCGGWMKFCRTEGGELPFLQRRFCAAHQAYSRMPDVREPVAYLPGEHETVNKGLVRGQVPVQVRTGIRGPILPRIEA